MNTKKKSIQVKASRMSIAAPAEKIEREYDRDFSKWTNSQVKFLKRKQFDKVDIENLIEEIESLGRSEKRALQNQIKRLLMHLLKLKYAPEQQGNSNSWKGSIVSATIEIKLLIKDSPSLKNQLIKIYPEAYEDAKQEAAVETSLDIKKFPEECPWELSEILPFLDKRK